MIEWVNQSLNNFGFSKIFIFNSPYLIRLVKKKRVTKGLSLLLLGLLIILGIEACSALTFTETVYDNIIIIATLVILGIVGAIWYYYYKKSIMDEPF